MKTRVAFKLWYHNGWASPIAGLISLWTWGKYSHVELIVGTNDDIHPLENGFSASAWDNDVRIKPIDFEKDGWHIVETGRDIDMEYIASVLGDDYDYVGIVLSEFLPLRLHIKNRYYCSETVACALGFKSCQKDPVMLHKTLVAENKMIEGWE